MARITHPHPQAGQQSFLGVTFHDGFAEVDLRGQDVLAQALLQHGYRIEAQVDVEGTERPTEPTKRPGKGKAAKAANTAEQVIAHADGSFTVPDGYTGVLPDADPSGYGPDATPFAVVELADGTIIGDGETLATLPGAHGN